MDGNMQKILWFSVQYASYLTIACPIHHYISFYVHGSVHQEPMSIIVQQDATIYSIIIFLQIALCVSNDNLIHHQEHIQTVITTSGTSRTVFATWRSRICSSDFSTSADGSKYGSTSARCNYNLSVLLMMDEGNIRNM